MLRLEYAPRAAQDLERLVDILPERDAAAAASTFALIDTALRMLPEHPLLGRPVEHGLRELVISRGRTGYLALYRVEAARSRVVVLALRHQREAGFTAADWPDD